MDAIPSEKLQYNDVWGNVTNPNLHDSDNFRYLVHTINPNAKASVGLLALSDTRFKDYQPTEYEDPSIDLLESPERVVYRIGLSTSLIDQDHTKTWGSVGLIIESSERNVMQTSSRDAGTPIWDKGGLAERRKSSVLLQPDALLSATDPDLYNEVVLLANIDGSNVKLKGFIVKTYDDGSVIDARLAAIVIAHSDRLGLPLVYVKEPNTYKEDKVLKVDDGYVLHMNSKRYMLLDKGNFAFKVLDQSGKSLVISPDELKMAVKYLYDGGGIGDDTIRTIEENYAKHDKKRCTPVVEYTSDGDIKYIQRRLGYGIDELELCVLQNGESRGRHILEFEQAFLSQIGGQKVKYPEEIRLSPEQTDQMIADAMNEIDDDSKEKIMNWYTGIRERIVRDWNQSTNTINLSSVLSIKTKHKK
jgi:hypothetical protein